jgi:Rieske Fe-S protein
MTETPAKATPGPSRRTVLASAGVVGVGVVTLAGCGSSADGATSSAQSAAIAKASIPVGGGTIFADQKIVVTQPTAGTYKAFSAVCTHQACIVATVDGGTINCACHGSRFDIATGDVTNGPATQPLPAKTVTIGTDGITVT